MTVLLERGLSLAPQRAQAAPNWGATASLAPMAAPFQAFRESVVRQKIQDQLAELKAEAEEEGRPLPELLQGKVELLLVGLYGYATSTCAMQSLPEPKTALFLAEDDGVEIVQQWKGYRITVKAFERRPLAAYMTSGGATQMLQDDGSWAAYA